nr:aromatic amino acid decarboxylase [Hymenolepis microstoma]
MGDGVYTNGHGNCNGKEMNNILANPAEYYAEMRSSCKDAVDIAVRYLEKVEKYRPVPKIKPGFLIPQIPSDPPKEGVNMQDIFKDVDRLLMPAVVHWNHPHFHAYFAMANSYPAVCADIIGSAIGGIGFTWASSPVSTELEYIMTNWLVKMLGLPDFYLHSAKGGGGVIGTSCSEHTIITMMAARNKAISKYISANPGTSKFEVLSKLVCYTSEQAHCSVERAGLLNLLPVKSLPVNDKFELTGETLEAAILKDIAEGKIPFYCVATLGTTGICSFDKLDELGPVCKKFDVWLHVDAAYAGSAFICPEYRHYLNGVGYTSSFAFNPHKWLLTNFDCSVAWFKDWSSVACAFGKEAQYLNYADLGKMPDYCNWQLSFGRKFRSLKLWFVIRTFGVAGLQKYIRQQIQMAKYLESLIKSDARFDIIGDVTMGLVCFRIKDNNELTKRLYERIENDGRIHLVTASVKIPEGKDIYFIRIAIVSLFTDEAICDYAFKVIVEALRDIKLKCGGVVMGNSNSLLGPGSRKVYVNEVGRFTDPEKTVKIEHVCQALAEKLKFVVSFNFQKSNRRKIPRQIA